MSDQAVETFDTLKRRVSFFLGDARDGRTVVRDFLGRAEAYGEVAIVGGMLRDLLIETYPSFTSDVDFVIDTSDVPALEKMLAHYNFERNRFGGYSLRTAWKVDIWPLSRTWAHVAGHCSVSQLEDVLSTTFFNWDAILYLCTQKRFAHRNDYIEHIHKRYLDINLEPNPNPLGSLVRTLRMAVRWRATLSPRLAEYARARLDDFGAERVCLAERASFRRPILQAGMLDLILKRLDTSVEGDPVSFNQLRQLELPFR